MKRAAPKQAKAPKAAAKPVTNAPPAAAPAQGHIPVAAPVGTAAAPAGGDSTWNLASEPEMSMMPSRRMLGRKTPIWLKITYLVVGLALLGGAGYGAYWVVTQKQTSPDDKVAGKGNKNNGETLSNDKRPDLGTSGLGFFNCRLPKPGTRWITNTQLAKRMKVVAAMSRVDATNFAALNAVKYEHAVPGDPILIDFAIRHIRMHLFDVAWEPKRPATLEGLEKRGKLDTEAALILAFEGKDSEDVVHQGEIYITHFRGVAYWLYTWAPATLVDSRVSEWSDVRDGFVLGRARVGWSSRARPAVAMKGKSEAYVLRARAEVWTKAKDPTLYGVETDLALQGSDPQEDDKTGKHAGKMGKFHVRLFPEKATDLGDASAYAQDDLKKQLANEGVENAELSVATNFETGDPLESRASLVQGKDVVQLVRWERKVDPSSKEVSYVEPDWKGKKKITDLQLIEVRAQVKGGTYDSFFLLAVVNLKSSRLIIRGESVWSRREYWRPEFFQLLRTFKPL